MIQRMKTWLICLLTCLLTYLLIYLLIYHRWEAGKERQSTHDDGGVGRNYAQLLVTLTTGPSFKL